MTANSRGVSIERNRSFGLFNQASRWDEKGIAIVSRRETWSVEIKKVKSFSFHKNVWCYIAVNFMGKLKPRRGAAARV
jgi:hypothetical protein